MINEFAYSHPFFFIGAILVHVLTPKMFPVMLIYIYSMQTFIFSEKGIGYKFEIKIMNVQTLILYFTRTAKPSSLQ